jgi:hypothetical protein
MFFGRNSHLSREGDIQMAFPAGSYTVTLGKSSHAHWQGTLTVIASGTTYTATYQRGQSPADAVTFTYGTSPTNWIAFTDGNVNFGQADLNTLTSKYSGPVTGLPPSLKEDASDTWTASTTSKASTASY